MNIYFSGIGGVGIGPLAEISFDAGYTIAGSDISDSLMVDQLTARGVSVNIGPQDGRFLQSSHEAQPIDWFVYTAALADTHPELVLARQLGLKVAKRDELLAHIIREKNLKLIAISGTHGKTTATAMLVWTLQQLHIPVSYVIGTTVSFGPSGKFDPLSEYFVYECDEFDRNFLHFFPYLSVITSLDYDHSDSYPTTAEYLDAFRQFATQSRHVITWNDQHGDIFTNISNVARIDPSQTNDSITLPGVHNRRNATLIEQAIRSLGIGDDVVPLLSAFPGTDRRFEKLAHNLYSDYGHHPVEIAATLQLAREVSDHVVLVYQPHQNIRQHEIKDDYRDQFENADHIYWLPTYLSREDPMLAILTPAELIHNITNKNNITIADCNDQLWENIQRARQEGSLVLGMGAGTIDGWLRDRLRT